MMHLAHVLCARRKDVLEELELLKNVSNQKEMEVKGGKSYMLLMSKVLQKVCKEAYKN